MNDPIHRLRTEGSRPDAGAPSDTVLAAIHARTAGERAGGLTRRRRAVRASVVGVAGAGTVLAGALVAPGLVPDDGAAPPAAGSPAVEVRDGIVGQDPSADDPVVSAVAYVERARTAVEEVDLSTLVLEVGSTFGVQHPGEAQLATSLERRFTAGDGSATRWILEREPATSEGADLTGAEDVQHVDPAGAEAQVTYWWVSPQAGVWTRFAVPVGGGDDGDEVSVQTQLAEWVAELGASLDEIETLAARPDVVAGEPTAATVGGRSATCFELSGTGDPAGGPDGEGSDPSTGAAGVPVTIDWTRTACFDDENDLPLSDAESSHYLVGEATEPSLLVTTDEYVWHPRDAASLALLQPRLEGLREVSQDEYARLTS